MKNIHKTISIALAAMLTMSFTGCNNSKDDGIDIDTEINVNITDDAIENSKSSPGDYMTQGNIDKDVIKDISAWIKKQ